MFCLKIIDANGKTAALARGENEVNLPVTREYQEGDTIYLEISEKPGYVWLQLEAAWFISQETYIIRFPLEIKESICRQRSFPGTSIW